MPHATIHGSHLRRIFSATPPKDGSQYFYRSHVWRIEVDYDGITASSAANECIYLLKAPAASDIQFSFTVHEWLMHRVASRLGNEDVEISPGHSSVVITTSGAAYRVLDALALTPNTSEAMTIPAGSTGWSVDRRLLRRAVRVVGAAMRDLDNADTPPAAAIQIGRNSTRTLALTASSWEVRADVTIPTTDAASLTSVFSVSRQHLSYALRLVGGGDEPVEIHPVVGGLIVHTRLGRVRVPELLARIPRLGGQKSAELVLVMDRTQLLSALEAVSALNEGGTMTVLMSVADDVLQVSGGNEKFGEVRSRVPLLSASPIEPFKVWRSRLEQWLKTVDSDSVSAVWTGPPARIEWIAAEHQLRSVLTMAPITEHQTW